MKKFCVEEQTENIINWIKDWYKDKSGYAIVCISGGKDSTIAAALCAKALGADRVIGVLMPNGEQKDIEDSKKVVDFLKIPHMTVNIGEAYNALTKSIDEAMFHNFDNISSKSHDVYKTNTPARIRMVAAFGIAALYGGYVVNTCNLSESVVGWETFGGDGFGCFSPLGKLTVQEVVAIGDYLNLPKELVHKTPSDGMCGSTDEEKLGFTYECLDNYIRTGVRPKSAEIYQRIMDLNKSSHFKHEIIHLPTYDPGLYICEDFNW